MNITTITNVDIAEPNYYRLIHAKQYDNARFIAAKLYSGSVPYEIPANVFPLIKIVKPDSTFCIYSSSSLQIISASTTAIDGKIRIDSCKYIRKNNVAGEKTFLYTTAWSEDIEEYGISFTGTPVNGNIITVLTEEKDTISYSGNTITFQLIPEALSASGAALVDIILLNQNNESVASFYFRLDIEPSVIKNQLLISNDYIDVLRDELESAIRNGYSIENLSVSAQSVNSDVPASAEISGGNGVPYSILFSIPKGYPGLSNGFSDYHNIVVPVNSWNNTKGCDSTYIYGADISISGITANNIPELVFDASDAVSGILAPIATTLKNKVRIYANELPSNSITIPTIIVWDA